MMLYLLIPEEQSNTFEKSLDANGLLRRLGASRKYTGFQYAVYMIDQVLENPDKLFLVTKRLYPEAAKHFGVSMSALERSVRTIIVLCWEYLNHALLDDIAGCDLIKIPTVVEFIDITVNYLRQNSGQ